MSIVKHFRSITPVPVHAFTITVTRHLSSVDVSLQGSAGDSGGGGGITGTPTGMSGGSSGGGGGGMLHSAAAAARSTGLVSLIVTGWPVVVNAVPIEMSMTKTSVQLTPVAVSDRRRPLCGGSGGAAGAAGCCKTRSGRRHLLGPNSVIRALDRAISFGEGEHDEQLPLVATAVQCW